MNVAKLTLPQKISAVSILIVVISAFLPWAAVLGITLIGLRGDGVLTLILSLAGVLLFVLGTELFFAPKLPPKAADIILLVLAGLTALIGIVSVARIGGFASIGVYLTMLAGIVWVAAAVWQMLAARGLINTRRE